MAKNVSGAPSISAIDKPSNQSLGSDTKINFGGTGPGSDRNVSRSSLKERPVLYKLPTDAKNKLKVTTRRSKREKFRKWFTENSKKEEPQQAPLMNLKEESSELTASMISELLIDQTFVQKRVSII